MKHVELKPRSKCGFCGAGNTTKEHILGDWIEKKYPEGRSDYKIWDSSCKDGIVHEKSKQGRIGGRKPRIVCLGCNGGWMSKLQQKTKPYLEVLLSRKSLDLDDDKRKTLAAWIMMTTITNEMSSKENAVISESQKTYLMNNSLADNDCEIWIGFTNAESMIRRLFHYRGNVSGTPYHATIISINNCLLISRTVHNSFVKESNNDILNMRLTKIWPLTLDIKSKIKVDLVSKSELKNLFDFFALKWFV